MTSLDEMLNDTLMFDARDEMMVSTYECSVEFVPNYLQLLRQSYAFYYQTILEMKNSNYRFPSSLISDLKKYYRFDVGDLVLIVVMAIAWTILRWLTTEAVFKPLSAYFQLLPSFYKKAPESFWKLLFYSGTVAYSGYLTFFTEEYNFFHRPGYVWEGWAPGMVIGSEVYIYYLIQGSFYIHSIYATIFLDAWRKDSYVMLGHHLLTSSLIFFSYGVLYCNLGLLLLLLHDITDVELEFGKLNMYFKRRGGKVYLVHEYISIMCAVLFFGTWLISRLYWFPTRALYSVSVLACGRLNLPFTLVFSLMLAIIFILNVYWFMYIVMLLIRVVTGQLSEMVDTREYDSSEAITKRISNNKTSHNGLHCSQNENNNSIYHKVTT